MKNKFTLILGLCLLVSLNSTCYAMEPRTISSPQKEIITQDNTHEISTDNNINFLANSLYNNKINPSALVSNLKDFLESESGSETENINVNTTINNIYIMFTQDNYKNFKIAIQLNKIVNAINSIFAQDGEPVLLLKLNATSCYFKINKNNNSAIKFLIYALWFINNKNQEATFEIDNKKLTLKQKKANITMEYNEKTFNIDKVTTFNYKSIDEIKKIMDNFKLYFEHLKPIEEKKRAIDAYLLQTNNSMKRLKNIFNKNKKELIKFAQDENLNIFDENKIKINSSINTNTYKPEDLKKLTCETTEQDKYFFMYLKIKKHLLMLNNKLSMALNSLQEIVYLVNSVEVPMEQIDLKEAESIQKNMALKLLEIMEFLNEHKEIIDALYNKKLQENLRNALVLHQTLENKQNFLKYIPYQPKIYLEGINTQDQPQPMMNQLTKSPVYFSKGEQKILCNSKKLASLTVIKYQLAPLSNIRIRQNFNFLSILNDNTKNIPINKETLNKLNFINKLVYQPPKDKDNKNKAFLNILELIHSVVGNSSQLKKINIIINFLKTQGCSWDMGNVLNLILLLPMDILSLDMANFKERLEQLSKENAATIDTSSNYFNLLFYNKNNIIHPALMLNVLLNHINIMELGLNFKDKDKITQSFQDYLNCYTKETSPILKDTNMHMYNILASIDTSLSSIGINQKDWEIQTIISEENNKFKKSIADNIKLISGYIEEILEKTLSEKNRFVKPKNLVEIMDQLTIYRNYLAYTLFLNKNIDEETIAKLKNLQTRIERIILHLDFIKVVSYLDNNGIKTLEEDLSQAINNLTSSTFDYNIYNSLKHLYLQIIFSLKNKNKNNKELCKFMDKNLNKLKQPLQDNNINRYIYTYMQILAPLPKECTDKDINKLILETQVILLKKYFYLPSFNALRKKFNTNTKIQSLGDRIVAKLDNDRSKCLKEIEKNINNLLNSKQTEENLCKLTILLDLQKQLKTEVNKDTFETYLYNNLYVNVDIFSEFTEYARGLYGVQEIENQKTKGLYGVQEMENQKTKSAKNRKKNKKNMTNNNQQSQEQELIDGLKNIYTQDIKNLEAIYYQHIRTILIMTICYFLQNYNNVDNVVKDKIKTYYKYLSELRDIKEDDYVRIVYQLFEEKYKNNNKIINPKAEPTNWHSLISSLYTKHYNPLIIYELYNITLQSFDKTKSTNNNAENEIKYALNFAIFNWYKNNKEHNMDILNILANNLKNLKFDNSNTDSVYTNMEDNRMFTLEEINKLITSSQENKEDEQENNSSELNKNDMINNFQKVIKPSLL